MTADSPEQAEREALGDTRARLWFAGRELFGSHIFYGGKGHEHFKPNCTCEDDYDAASTAHEDAARAAGRAEAEEALRELLDQLAQHDSIRCDGRNNVIFTPSLAHAIDTARALLPSEGAEASERSD